MSYQWKDYYFKKAKKENYVARSVFKLEEIQGRYHLLRPGQSLLDLGAAPGSWSQYASQQLGVRGKILGIDLQSVPLTIPRVQFIQGDLRTLSLEAVLPEGYSLPFDGVLSDMAPKTTGVAFSDQVQSFELCCLALEWSEKALKKGGYFICKFFQGPEFETLRSRMRPLFAKVQILKPKSTRPGSKEIFLIGIGFSG